MGNCPNCREVMGNNMNLLAKTVIENIDHECTNEGCNEMLSQQEVLRHKEFLCIFRKVLCPLNPSCMQMVVKLRISYDIICFYAAQRFATSSGESTGLLAYVKPYSYENALLRRPHHNLFLCCSKVRI